MVGAIAVSILINLHIVVIIKAQIVGTARILARLNFLHRLSCRVKVDGFGLEMFLTFSLENWRRCSISKCALHPIYNCAMRAEGFEVDRLESRICWHLVKLLLSAGPFEVHIVSSDSSSPHRQSFQSHFWPEGHLTYVDRLIHESSQFSFLLLHESSYTLLDLVRHTLGLCQILGPVSLVASKQPLELDMLDFQAL